jgi:putative transposase
VTARGNRRQGVFVDDADRERFLTMLETTVDRYGWACHAYCLMDNHVHLLIQTPTESLSQGMQWLLGCYAQGFNRRHGYDGHLFQGRFHSVLVASSWHLLELARYVALNPVRARMCATPRDWPWSSFRATAGLAARPRFLALDWMLAQFGREPAVASQAYATFVAEGAPGASA